MADNEKMNTQNEEKQEPKTFTQEEVDEIVRKRLARERKKADVGEGVEPGTDREKSLDARELRIMAREKLQDSGMPMSLADVLKYSDEESLEEAIEIIKNLDNEPRKSWGQRQSGRKTDTDKVREAMGL